MNERIKEIRKELNLTMEKFGSKLGVGKTAISKIENGERGITEQMIRSICREYHVSENWFRTGEGERFLPMDKENLLMQWAGNVLGQENDTFKKRFVTMLSQLNDKDWEVLEKMAMELSDKKE